ncbi:hypothetical protein E8E11_000447 [Didymella keratinophila]|nr:hypothetical protein E8E11_000447 [Didymella keratinophila]
MAANLNAGFAVGGCDSGHLTSENGPSRPGGYVSFLNSYAETTAWIRDSIAMFPVPAKAITASFYRCSPKKAYYSRCSTGGAQGYAPAQYHPRIFDGIVAEELYTAYTVPILQNLIYENLSYNYTTFDFQDDVRTVDIVAGPLITATSLRLDALEGRGGKLITTQGWANLFNAPTWPIDQHDAARAIYGEKALNDFWRLFMVPGGGHCGSAASYSQMPAL